MENSNQGSVEQIKNQGGRPSKFTKEFSEKFLSFVRDGMPLTHAASACGVCYRSLTTYRNEHPEFSEAITEALSHGIQVRLDIVKKCTESSDQNVALRAATWWLTHVPGSAEHFSESRKVEVTGELDGRVLTIVWPHTQKQNTELPISTDE
jgi:hypothetical protein